MLEQRIGDTNDLALKLYHELRGTGENLLISPHSIAVCCAMAYAGARGATERQMAQALCFPRPQAGFHEAIQALGDSLGKRGVGLGADAFQLRIVNGAWGAAHWPYRQSYCRLLSTYYGAGLTQLDFAREPEASLEVINRWVAEQTEGRVQNLLPAGCIDAQTYLVLANTVYFKASWLHQFQTRLTVDGEFLLLDGTTVRAPMMHGEQTFGYLEGDGYRAVELPYVGHEVSMIAVLPDSGRFEAFEGGLDGEQLAAIAAALTPTWITLWLPRFSYESAFDLVETLQALGMTDAFDPGADFTGMDGVDDGQPWIDEVVHKSFIAVDEYGTEAAGGTAMELTCGIHDSFPARRPFIFAIRDRATGTILFLGRVLDPR
jgi:serpin B